MMPIGPLSIVNSGLLTKMGLGQAVTVYFGPHVSLYLLARVYIGLSLSKLFFLSFFLAA